MWRSLPVVNGMSAGQRINAQSCLLVSADKLISHLPIRIETVERFCFKKVRKSLKGRKIMNQQQSSRRYMAITRRLIDEGLPLQSRYYKTHIHAKRSLLTSSLTYFIKPQVCPPPSSHIVSCPLMSKLMRNDLQMDHSDHKPHLCTHA